MSKAESLRTEFFSRLFLTLLFGGLTYYGVKILLESVDSSIKRKRKSQEKAEKTFKELGIDTKRLDLTEHELTVASDLLHPKNIEVTFEDIAGLESIIEELRCQVILPLKNPELFESALRQPPSGVLFHGPPGCGKTMLAKAIAKEAGVRFINLSLAILTDKWYGESQKLASALFSLAMKIQPCIIFIDEIDSFLRSRETHDHEATAMMKAQFMTHWDGLLSSHQSKIVIIGATNRPSDVDKAVLRRMPATFAIDLPNKEERRKILQLILKNETLASDVNLDEIAAKSNQFSGSDLKDLCRRAAMQSMKEISEQLKAFKKLTTNQHQSSESSTERKFDWRPITMADLIAARNFIEHAKHSVRPGA